MKELLFFAFVLFSVSCSKNDDLDDYGSGLSECERYSIGSVKVVNNLDDPYKIYINDEYLGIVDGGGNEKTFSDLTKGQNEIHAIQASGFIINPTEYTAEATVVTCKTTTVSLD